MTRTVQSCFFLSLTFSIDKNFMISNIWVSTCTCTCYRVDDVDISSINSHIFF